MVKRRLRDKQDEERDGETAEAKRCNTRRWVREKDEGEENFFFSSGHFYRQLYRVRVVSSPVSHLELLATPTLLRRSYAYTALRFRENKKRRSAGPPHLIKGGSIG